MSKYEFDKSLGKWVSKVSQTSNPVVREKAVPVGLASQGISENYSRNGNYFGNEEDFLHKVDFSKKVNNFPSTDRSWSIVEDDTKTLSLEFIITKIIESYGKDKYKIVGMPSEWAQITYTVKKPLEQDSSDWALFMDICKDKGYRIVREDFGRTFRFVKESEGIENRPLYRVVVHNYGGDLFDLDFLHKTIEENPTFIVKGDLGITISSDTGFIPQVRQFLDDEGQSKIVINIPEGMSAFLANKYTLLYDRLETDYLANRAGTLTGEEKKFFDAVTRKNPTLQDYLKYYSVESPDYNSNNTDDEGYTVHPYEGWEANFETSGNMWAVPGEWIVLEGTSSNLYFPFQIKSVVHSFGHKWATQYELVR